MEHPRKIRHEAGAYCQQSRQVLTPQSGVLNAPSSNYFYLPSLSFLQETSTSSSRDQNSKPKVKQQHQLVQPLDFVCNAVELQAEPAARLATYEPSFILETSVTMNLIFRKHLQLHLGNMSLD